MTTNAADKENNPSKGKGEGSDSHLIGPRQEYRRTGRAPDNSDSGVSTPEHGKASTPYKY